MTSEIREIAEAACLRPKTPPCQAQRRNRYANDVPGPLPQCERQSAYVINGKHLCRPHAGVVALQLLLDQSSQNAKSQTATTENQ